jgi:hypothetical protein
MKWSGDGSVPVLFAGRGVDDVAGTDLVDVLTAGLGMSDAFGDVEGVGVPGGAGAGGKCTALTRIRKGSSPRAMGSM